MTKRFSIMVLDDEVGIVKMLERAFKEYDMSGFSEVKAARQYLAANRVDVLLLDYRLGDDNGLDLMMEFKAAHQELEVILITGYGDINMAVKAIKNGAFHFLAKPFEIEVLKHLVKNALFRRESVIKLEALRGQVAEKYRLENLIGSSAKTMNLKELARRAAEVETNLLITGEAGVGKEFVARIIHTSSIRSERPFIAVPCATLSAEELSRELLGVDSDNGNRRIGAIETAGDGVLLLSEVFSIEDEQMKLLLEIIKTKKYQPAGLEAPIQLEARIIISTSINEDEIVARSEISKELYLHICSFPLIISPLRERLLDIKDLSEFFLRKNGEKLSKKFERFSAEAMAKLQSYSWLGNVRHLENVIERVSILETSREITDEYLPEEIKNSGAKSEMENRASASYRQCMKMASGDAATKYLKDVLKKTDGNVTKASKIAGMERESFHRLLKKHHVKSKSV